MNRDDQIQHIFHEIDELPDNDVASVRTFCGFLLEVLRPQERHEERTIIKFPGNWIASADTETGA